MTTKQTNPKESNREQVLLLAGIPLEKAEAAREALAEIGITFSYRHPGGTPLHQGAPRGRLPGLRLG